MIIFILKLILLEIISTNTKFLLEIFYLVIKSYGHVVGKISSWNFENSAPEKTDVEINQSY